MLLAAAVGSQAQVVEIFVPGSGETPADLFPGAAARGWLTAWTVAPNTGASGVEKIVTPADPEYLALSKAGGNYLQLHDWKGAGVRDTAQRAVLRQYGDFEALATNSPHTISFLLRLDSGLGDLTEINIFDSNQSTAGPVLGRFAWLIKAEQGGTWQFVNNTANTFADSGIPAREGSTYLFRIALDPQANSYRVFLKDETTGKEHQSANLAFQRKTGAIGGWIGWAMTVRPEGESIVSLGEIVIAPQSANDGTGVVESEVVWMGEALTASAPRGVLLTENPGYYGETASVGVTYSYPTAPNNPADNAADQAEGRGRLLDGRTAGDWTIPVGINHVPLVVDFQFTVPVTVYEVDVAAGRLPQLRAAGVAIKDESSGDWRDVPVEIIRSGDVIRILLEEPAPTRDVRISVQSTGAVTYIDEVWVWGEPASAQPTDVRTQAQDPSVLGQDALSRWRTQSGFIAHTLAWQVADGWSLMEKDALETDFLPDGSALGKPLAIATARNESDAAALFLVNASGARQSVKVELGSFVNQRGETSDLLTGEVYVGGIVQTRRWGAALRPLFAAGNKLGETLMERYVLNAAIIKKFPVLELPYGGTAFLWVKVTANDAEPGRYRALLRAGTLEIPVECEVLPLTLPYPQVWVRSWSESSYGHGRNLTFPPFRAVDYLDREIDYQHALGVSAWRGFPEEGSFLEAVRERAQTTGVPPQHFVTPFSADIMNRGYNGQLDPATFTDEFRESVRQRTRELVAQAEQLGLGFDDWSVELWDEPTIHNMESWRAIAELIKTENPNVPLYMNPLFWTRQGTNPGFVSDATQVQYLSGWYNELVDISVPILGQINENVYPLATTNFYDHLPRKVRAFFIHPSGGRTMPWEAFRRSYNGWGFYSYYQPRNNPWDDLDHTEFDYQMVYPGPRGPILTLESEAMREGWDDYRLLSYLKDSGREHELNRVIGEYELAKLPVYIDAMDLQATFNEGLPVEPAIVVSELGVSFSHAIVEAELSPDIITLQRNGASVTTNGVSIEPREEGIDGRDYRITGLAEVCSLPGDYVLTLDLSRLHKRLSGEPGSGTAPVAFSIQSLQSTLTLTASPEAGGTVTGQGTYDQGLTVVITALSAEGYRFVEWQEQGASIGNSPDHGVTLVTDRHLTAVFATNSLSRYLDWMQTFFPGETDPELLGLDKDPGGNGFSNLADYILGFDPAAGDVGEWIQTTFIEGEDGKRHSCIIFVCRNTDPHILVDVIVSADHTLPEDQWMVLPSEISTDQSGVPAGFIRMRVVDPEPMPGADYARKFYKLRFSHHD